MVGAVVSAAPVAVEDGGQVRKVPVQVNVLSVATSVGPSVQHGALRRSSASWHC